MIARTLPCDMGVCGCVCNATEKPGTGIVGVNNRPLLLLICTLGTASGVVAPICQAGLVPRNRVLARLVCKLLGDFVLVCIVEV
jgi:hypothetical protein